MSDIELVVKIPEEMYAQIIDKNGIDTMLIPYKDIIKNGTPLPKRHGRIVDENKITKCEQIGLVIKHGNVTPCLITDAPTIIESDK